MFDRLQFLISEALTSLRRNPWMTFAAISTTCIALFLTGGVGFAIRGVNQYAETIPAKFEMRVFLKDGLKPEAAQKTIKEIQGISGIKEVTFLSRAEAWARFKKQNPQVPTKDLENPLPDSANVIMSDVDRADAISATIQKIPNVAKDGVKFLSREREMLSQIIGFLRLVGYSLGTLMLLTSGILIYNTIRLTIVARRREFKIMHLVGASRLTVVTPLLIEGILQGVLGGIFASLLVLGSHNVLRTNLESFRGIMSIGELGPSLVFSNLVGLGALYGLVCSFIAVRDPKRVQ